MTYQEEQNILLKKILLPFHNFFSLPLEEQNDEEKNIKTYGSGCLDLELFISPECNQQCSYCYLVNNKQLYPDSANASNKKIILKNLILLLNYYSNLNYSFSTIHFFSGEILGTKFSYQVFDIILYYIKNNKIKIDTILIPTNFSFIINEAATKKIQRYIETFKFYKTQIQLSASNDGFFVDKETRPFKNKELNQTIKNELYYNKIIDFCGKNLFCYHPMISIHNIDYQIENYKWWYEQIEKYPKVYKNMYQASMFLEVRNDFWDNKSILKYLKFLNFMIDYDIEKYWKKENNFTPLYSMLSGKPYFNKEIQKEIIKKHSIKNYIPYRISTNNGKPGCGVINILSIRLGDLAIVPCHRTSYDKFIFGYYKVKNNKIIDIEAKNVNLAFRILNQTHRNSPICNNCKIYDYCLYGCYGAQYEANEDILYPCKSVCELQKAKFIFSYLKSEQILQKYKDKITIGELSNSLEIKNIYLSLIQTKEGQLWKKAFYTMNY